MRLPHLIGFIVIVFLIQIVGSTTCDLTWYQSIEKPSWTPPGWIFGPVWTILYLMIGIAGARLFDNKHKGLLGLFFLQLGFNAIWSWLFFGLNSPLLAMIDLTALWISLSWLIVLCFRSIKVCGYLLTPYYLWTSFALILNIAIWWMNR